MKLEVKFLKYLLKPKLDITRTKCSFCSTSSRNANKCRSEVGKSREIFIDVTSAKRTAKKVRTKFKTSQGEVDSTSASLARCVPYGLFI